MSLYTHTTCHVTHVMYGCCMLLVPRFLHMWLTSCTTCKLCMCTCSMYTYILIHMYIYPHDWTNVSRSMHMYSLIHISSYICTYIHVTYRLCILTHVPFIHPCEWALIHPLYTYTYSYIYPHTYVHTASCVHVVCRIYLPGKESEQYRGDRKRGREARRTAQTTNAFLFTCCLISSCKVQLHPLYTCTSCSSLYIHKALYTHTTQGLASVHTCVCDAVYVCISLASVHTKYNSRVVTHK